MLRLAELLVVRHHVGEGDAIRGADIREDRWGGATTRALAVEDHAASLVPVGRLAGGGIRARTCCWVRNPLRSRPARARRRTCPSSTWGWPAAT